MAIEQKKCTPCEAGTPPLDNPREEELLKEVSDWKLNRAETHRLEKTFSFGDFDGSMRFVNDVAAIAREQGHHPDMCISYDTVRCELSTHKIKGLSENDFILAAKINKAGK